MNLYKKVIMWLAVMPGLMLYCTSVSAVSLADHPKLQSIADELVAEKHYTADEIKVLFSAATIQQSVLDAMQNPAEYKFTWGKYRKIFLQQDRIDKGLAFWQEYATELARAEQEYGVPASIIVAIIGVESKFGQYKGSHKVLDSLVSLVVGYPRRSDFFARELKHFFILCKQNQLDTTQLLGSYAGAVGFPQFISSSYRNYAVDFSADGRIDLINQPTDAIGSIANYFVENGWKTSTPITSKAFTEVPVLVQEQANRELKTKFSKAQLIKMGASLDHVEDQDEKLNVLMLDASEEVHEEEITSYIVRAGDTACQIAERFFVSCKKLFALNKLNPRGLIYRGQKLKLPQQSPKLTTSNSSKWNMNNSQQSSKSQPRYFYTHHNFYVITRYNRSVLYAMAVNDLHQALQNTKLAFN